MTSPAGPEGEPRGWQLEPARDHGMPLGERMRSLRRESGLIESALHIGWWSLVRGYMVIWHRLRIEGRENLPRTPPFILVANHASHLDALVLASPLSWRVRDGVFPLAAGDTFFETPLSSAFAAFLLNALPIWRKRCGPRALSELRDRLLSERCGYILFPEGTRSRGGEMSGFKPGLGMLVAGTDVPVVPCRIEGTWAALPPGRVLPRPRRITVRVGEPLAFAETANEKSGWIEVATRTEEAVKALG